MSTIPGELFARDAVEVILPGAILLRGFAASETSHLMAEVARIAANKSGAPVDRAPLKPRD